VRSRLGCVNQVRLVVHISLLRELPQVVWLACSMERHVLDGLPPRLSISVSCTTSVQPQHATSARCIGRGCFKTRIGRNGFERHSLRWKNLLPLLGVGSSVVVDFEDVAAMIHVAAKQ